VNVISTFFGIAIVRLLKLNNLIYFERNKMVNYNFEWDLNKARSNQSKHGVSFEEAATVFRDPKALSIFDDEHSINEDRWTTIGISNTGRLLIVCHTFQKDDENDVAIRIFSGRKAIKKEIKQYKD
jgi:hypothetical protein